jgi:hypothetical protein
MCHPERSAAESKDLRFASVVANDIANYGTPRPARNPFVLLQGGTSMR